MTAAPRPHSTWSILRLSMGLLGWALIVAGCARAPSADSAEDADPPRGGGLMASGGRSESGGGGAHTGLGGAETGLGGAHTGLGGAETGLGGAHTGLGGAATYDCDARRITCATLAPVDPCEPGFVHSVVDSCHGPCVRVELCVCESPQECPDPDGTQPYTCLNMTHRCSPWLR